MTLITAGTMAASSALHFMLVKRAISDLVSLVYITALITARNVVFSGGYAAPVLITGRNAVMFKWACGVSTREEHARRTSEQSTSVQYY